LRAVESPGWVSAIDCSSAIPKRGFEGSVRAANAASTEDGDWVDGMGF